MCKARQVDVGWSLISCLALHSHRLQKLVFFSFYELWVLKVLTRKTKQNFPIQNLFCCCPMSLYRILSRLKQKFSTFIDHMIKFLLPEFGQAGWDNIWFSVKAHGPCRTLYIICTVNKYTSTSQSRDAGPKVSTVLHSTLQDQQYISQPTVNRQSPDIQTNSRPMHHPICTHLLVDCRLIYRSTIGRQSTNYWSIVDQYIDRLSADASANMGTFIDRLSADISVQCRPIYRSTIDGQSVDCRPIVDLQSVDSRSIYRPMYQLICPPRPPIVHMIR